MKLVEKLFIIFISILPSPRAVNGATSADDLTNIWNKISKDHCVNGPTYSFVDPTNCEPKCNFDETPVKKFCALANPPPTTLPRYTCNQWFKSCDLLLTTTTSVAATTASTTAVSTSTVSTSVATTFTSVGTTVADVSTATTTSANLPTTPSEDSNPTPQMSDSAKKWVGKGDSTAVNSKVPVAQKAMKDYLNPVKCCEMAKKKLCDDNKFYMRIACANTCGSVGTDIYNAGAGAKSTLRADCK